MSKQKQNTKGILIYNLLLKEVSKINKTLPEDRKLSMADRYKLISTKLYPKYKHQPRSSIRLTPLREKAASAIRRIPKKIGCDVLAIDPASYQDITYFEIEPFVRDVLPNCIFLKVNAKSFGSTNIFNTRDFNYYSTGLSDITNRINDEVRNLNKNTGDLPEYSGYIRLFDKKPNNGNPENYYLEMLLMWEEDKPEQQLTIPRTQKSKTRKKNEKKVQELVRSRLKTLKNQKSAFKPIKRNIQKVFSLVEQYQKNRRIPKADKKKLATQEKQFIKGYVKKKFDSGKITERKYKYYIKNINDFFGRRKG